MSIDKDRMAIFNFVNRELEGPTDDNGGDLSEELCNDRPSSLYFCGALFPKDSSFDEDNAAPLNDDEFQSPDSLPTAAGAHSNEDAASFFDLTEDEETYLNLSNAFKQSAVSLTVALRDDDRIQATAKWGAYKKNEVPSKDPKANGKTYAHFKREGKETKSGWLLAADIFNKRGNPIVIDCAFGNHDGFARLAFYPRGKVGDLNLITVSLVNESVYSPTVSTDEQTMFQTSLSLACENGFSPIPHSKKTSIKGDEELLNSLLYSKHLEYAVGHGCSPLWDDSTYEAPKEIKAAFMPFYEIHSPMPTSVANLELDMIKMATDRNYVLGQSKILCEAYRRWIDKQTNEIDSLKNVSQEAREYAKKTIIPDAKECLARLEKGIQLLKENDLASKAFMMSNRAMAMQQLHSKLPVLEPEVSSQPHSHFSNQISFEKSDQFVGQKWNDRLTWKLEGASYLGYWRSFQFAFLLLNLASIVYPDDGERRFVELIWFATGGGKTEAYLGLSAFAIIWKRLTKRDSGRSVQVFMRYTLRLLTSQQFERASALACALEKMRQENPADLGNTPIRIGLWVGGGTTPNTSADAKKKVLSMNKGIVSDNPFILNKCPWCGARMGQIVERKKVKAVSGYKMVSGHFRFVCSNPDCDFHSESSPLPMFIVDEDIYENPPTILIGTIDKFAMLPIFSNSIRNLFGLQDGPKPGREHPELIIQDELHLISGPLGSTMAAYETLIDALCSFEQGDGSKTYRPKIIASTATISQAKQQCKSIFDAEEKDVKIFPPSGLSADDSFFAKAGEKQNGRLYVGVYSPGASSASFSNIHLLGAIYQAARCGGVSDPFHRDAYFTNLCYFNSLRELGQAATWINADVKEFMKSRYRLSTTKLINYLELTSRIDSGNLTSEFDKLTITSLHAVKGTYPVDICLATNMVSVGIDVNRLGLMTVFGQPKTTSEYIQTTSRVGRDGKNRPGIVFVSCNPGRPRDKSIFEGFQQYHSRFYSFVEPMSVTPFSANLRAKVLPALLVGLIRLLRASSSVEPSDEKFNILLSENGELAKKIVMDRASRVDPDEMNNVGVQITNIFEIWRSLGITNSYYTSWTKGVEGKPNELYAIYASSDETKNAKWHSKSFAAPTSMRSVDKECYVDEKIDEWSSGIGGSYVGK